MLEPKCDPSFYEATTQDFLHKEEDMRTVLHTVLSAKFEENFIREAMEDESAKQKDSQLEEDEPAPKKRKQGPLMANTLQEVTKIFEMRKATAGKKLHNAKVSMLLNQFYDPYEVVLRLNLYKDRINTSKRRAAGVPLHAFYLNVSQNERLAYLFDIHEPEKKKLSATDGPKDKEENLSEAKKAINAFVKKMEEQFQARMAEEATK